MKKGKKDTINLMTIALLMLIVTGIIGNSILGGLAVVLAMAVVATVITARIGNFIRKRKEDS
ncbi:hypothetical protein ACQVQT_16300 [Bacillus paranthracis]|uniref:Uncharacterized protein n=4 Tax=Bacillus cereus group TaxID=86661 RepID=A0A5M9GV73_9BACI|nr:MULTISPECIES: hypothetical protein [Bacillus]ACM14693.1 conserved hypothetical protein [Bacillus cereus Q1]KLA00019.1 hypothetical protein B4086_4164 [Bacillus cereus]OUB97996.1 hypothetical protein BK752_12665 [Bacillus thuringiensis serovar canadensis]CKE87154.1 Uncharacterised protein [Streptococcus pneumoniae]AYY28940.1 hypothetical protein EGX95_21150 [Bacillus sp. FDAARGOS_527]